MLTQVTITKLDHARHPKASYPGQIVFRDENVLVARCVWTRPGFLDLGPFGLEEGDIFIEYYYPGEWFNIFKIYTRFGMLKGWYCNITAPVQLTEDEIRWQDLAIDLLILPDGRQVLMDEQEFEALQPSAEWRAQVAEALATLRHWVQENRPPLDRPNGVG